MCEIKINENLSVKLELRVEESNALGVSYDFTFFQNGSQVGKVSACCDSFSTLDENGLPVVEIATEECNGSFQDFWEKYKDLWKPINYGKIRLLLRGAICALDIMQKSKNINT